MPMSILNQKVMGGLDLICLCVRDLEAWLCSSELVTQRLFVTFLLDRGCRIFDSEDFWESMEH